MSRSRRRSVILYTNPSAPMRNAADGIFADYTPLLRRKDWYPLLIPKEEMQFRSFRQVRRWQEIAGALLTKYADRFYKFKRQEYESGHLEYRDLT